jgi:hypothetical protein
MNFFGAASDIVVVPLSARRAAGPSERRMRSFRP